MERQRRVALRLKFEQLASAVPELRALSKPSKVVILNTARKYILALENSSAVYATQMERHNRLRKKYELLKQKLASRY